MNHLAQLPKDHNGVSTTVMDECMSYQIHGVTKWCWRDKGRNRLQQDNK